MEKNKFIEDRIFEVSMAKQKVLLKQEPKQEKTKSGIFIPENKEEDQPKICTVLRAGKGDIDTPMMYSPGQKVLLSKYSGVEIEFNLKGSGYGKYIVTNQIDIMLTLEEVS